MVTKVERISETLTKALSFSAPLGSEKQAGRQCIQHVGEENGKEGRKEEVSLPSPSVCAVLIYGIEEIYTILPIAPLFSGTL